MTTSLHRDPLMSDLFECFRGFKTLMRRVAAPHELSGTHMQALRVLFLQRCSTMSRLTDCMHVSPGASTGIIDRLCKLGLVDRTPHPEDRRVVQVCLTEKGQEFVLALQQEMLHEFNQVRAKLSEAEQEAVSAGLHVLAKAFQASATHPQG
ncbi:MAG TPA: MarR family transcriptional regulator, partial [Stenomitos sp.]